MTVADYSSAILVPAHPSNYQPAARGNFSMVVIHVTDGHADARPVAEMWQQPKHKSSAHFVVGQDGTVIQSVMLHDIAWHAHNVNRFSVGVEHCARSPRELGPDDPGLPPSEELYKASARLVAWLCLHAGLAPTRASIKGHAEADVATTHSDCPDGAPWDWDHYIDLVENAHIELLATAFI